MSNDDEAFRMQVISQARKFKRSWVDMAEVLVQVRSKKFHDRWGFESLQGYALEELNIKRSTVDKLTGSYQAMEQHVPHALSWDGVGQTMPEVDAVDYFARAMDPPKKEGVEPRPVPSDEVVDEMKKAIFEEQVSSPSLRRRFNPMLNPKTEEDVEKEMWSKLRSSARKLEGLVGDVEGLSEDCVAHVHDALEELRKDIELLDPEGD